MRKASYLPGLTLLVAACLYLLPTLQAAENPLPDSPAVTELLTQAKERAGQLVRDADEMQMFAVKPFVPETHAHKINTIKDHVNKIGEVLQQMENARGSASPWQQRSIDRITPLARELAANIETTIDHINENQSRLNTQQYKEYLKVNYEVSSNLSELIDDFVEYGNAKANYERIGSQLELPGH